MRYYAIISTDVPHSLANRLANHTFHLARIKNLQEEGRLLIAGPLPAIDSDEPGPAGFIGNLIVAKFSSLQAATLWVEADPYHIAGVYHNVEVKPFTWEAP